MRFTFKLVLSLVAVIALAGLLAKANADRHYFDAYDPTVPLNAQIAEQGSTEAYDREKIYIDSTPGERVPAILTLPKGSTAPVPCIVFLHGIGQSVSFVEEISPMYNQAGWAMISFDQYTRGERKLPKDATPWQQLVAFRQRACKTVNDARRIADYLVTRPDIDPERLYLVGASYGAITGSTAAAFDPRFKAVVLVYGGGNVRNLMQASAIRGEMDKGPLGWLVADAATALARYVLAPADPARYAHRISPRPVLIQNGTKDVLIADEAAKSLQDAIGEPKKVVIYPGDHIGLDEATVRQVLKDGLAWLQEQDAAQRVAAAAN